MITVDGERDEGLTAEFLQLNLKMGLLSLRIAHLAEMGMSVFDKCLYFWHPRLWRYSYVSNIRNFFFQLTFTFVIFYVLFFKRLR